nr:glutaredoxin family protein [Neobacillus sp. Marseille-Q6967]
MPQTIITLYTRKRCSLCDKAKNMILELQDQYKFSLEEIYIEKSDELTERYGIMIPVVHINGEEVAFGIINKMDISNRLQEKTENF